MCFAFLEDPILVALLLPLDEPVWILTLILLMFRLHQHFQSWIHLSTDAVGGRSSLQHVGVQKRQHRRCVEPSTHQWHEHGQNSCTVLHLGQWMGLDIQRPNQLCGSGPNRPSTSSVVRNTPDFALLWTTVPRLNASNSGIDEATSWSSTPSGDLQHWPDPGEGHCLQRPENSRENSLQRGCQNMGWLSWHWAVQHRGSRSTNVRASWTQASSPTWRKMNMMFIKIDPTEDQQPGRKLQHPWMNGILNPQRCHELSQLSVTKWGQQHPST